jgi:hypothetical protein
MSLGMKFHLFSHFAGTLAGASHNVILRAGDAPALTQSTHSGFPRFAAEINQEHFSREAIAGHNSVLSHI